jgi:Transglycosylase-like domain/LysM domain
MKRRTALFLFLLPAVSLPLFASPAGAMPTGPDGPSPEPVLARSDAPPKVDAVQAPLAKVTVIAGDTLTAIGARTARTWEQLAAYNHLSDPDLILVGQVFTIPPASYAPPALRPSTTTSTTSTPVASPSVTVSDRPVEAYSSAPSGGVWACIAYHESTGNWSADTGNGYYGGLQFDLSTWAAYGGAGNPADASPAEQMAVADRVVAARGYGAWPNTGRMCGV